MSNHQPISDENPSNLPEPVAPNKPAAQGANQPKDGETPPVDPASLADYAEFQAWKQSQAEREAGDATSAAAALDVQSLVLEIPDGDTVHTFRIVDLSKDVLAHLQVLATFADTDMDRAAAIFEALLGPVEYERLRKTVRPMFRRIALAHEQDPENKPSVGDVWTNMATAISQPIKELSEDPKRIDSLRGASATGDESRSTSTDSALPQIN